MKLRKIITLLLCFSLVFLAFGLVSSVSAHPDNDTDNEENVITTSDAGGGNISNRDLLWIILALVALLVIIVAV